MRFCNQICIPESGIIALRGQAVYWPNTFEGQSVSLRHDVQCCNCCAFETLGVSSYFVIRNTWNGLET